MLDGGRQKPVEGWTGREKVYFPEPLGERWVYSIVDVPDYFLQPRYFGAKTVEFKTGSELDGLNRCLPGLRQVKKILDLKTLGVLVPLPRGLIYFASLLGASRGAVMVEFSGQDIVRPR